MENFNRGNLTPQSHGDGKEGSMDINEMTLGQIKELQSILSLPASGGNNLFARYVGKYAICRSRNEGVNAGVVVDADETGVVLKEARRLYYHKPINKNVSWYEGVALSGLSSDSKIGPSVEKIIVEDYSLTICSKGAEDSIRGAMSNVQS